MMSDCWCVGYTTVSLAKTAELEWAQVTVIRWGCTLTPPGEYDGSIFAVAAMRPYANITVDPFYAPVKVKFSAKAYSSTPISPKNP